MLYLSLAKKTFFKQIKKEPASPQHFLQMPPSPDDSHDIWELLCGPDIKPNVKVSPWFFEVFDFSDDVILWIHS